MFFENSLIFHPIRYPDGDWSPPGLAHEDVAFQADDGTKLHGWFVPHEAPKAVVLFCHGNGGNLTHRAEVVRDLRARTGVSVFIFDYRGYGRSEGSPTVDGALADARAARTWLAKRAGLPPEKLVLFGESLGAAVAVQLAGEGGARGLILQNAFDSLATVGSHHYPWLPVRLLLRTKLDSAESIRRYHGPLLQFHGDADRIVPYVLGRRLFGAPITTTAGLRSSSTQSLDSWGGSEGSTSARRRPADSASRPRGRGSSGPWSRRGRPRRPRDRSGPSSPRRSPP
jgi:pimeloyl-ACP methyl ester carboxylesterase